METLLGLILIVVFWVLCKLPEWRGNNRVCPPGKEIDYEKANRDLTIGGISKQEFYNRYNNGYYDRDKK